MIKFTGSDDSGSNKTLFLGLTDRNLELLRAGRPVKIMGAEVGVSHTIMIFHGADEQSIIDMLQRNGVDLSNVPVHKHHDDDRQEGGEH